MMTYDELHVKKKMVGVFVELGGCRVALGSSQRPLLGSVRSLKGPRDSCRSLPPRNCQAGAGMTVGAGMTAFAGIIE